MNFTEETEGGSIDAGSSFDISLGFNAGETTVESVSVTDYETTDGSDDYVGYVSSDLATQTMFATGGDQDSVDITYHGSEAVAEVFLSEVGTSISGGDGSSELGAVTVEDTEVSSMSSKNLVVVGGSCINSVAANLLGESACGSAFTDLTDVAAGQFLVQVFDSPYTSGKVAMLVAGYNADDTTKAVTYVTNNDVDTTVGTKLKGTSATEATVVTA